jgi:hypothetical protein
MSAPASCGHNAKSGFVSTVPILLQKSQIARRRLLQQYLPGADIGSQKWRPSLFRQKLHPMIAHWVPVFLRTGIDSRAIARHEYAVEPLII